ncbi:MAG TPA: ComEC/Rec2 family competence protein [Phycisphaerae bacterium]|nr:ComEC/Rec2 family competence protein [Phycisphaerae bacterium]
MDSSQNQARFWQHNPLVPAAALFLLGVALGLRLRVPDPIFLAAAALTTLIWIVSELRATPRIATAALSATLLLAGILLSTLNQTAVEPLHIARFAPPATDRPTIVALRARVDVPPDNPASHGNQYWIAHATEIYTTQGWLPSTGDLMVQWAAPPAELHPGTQVELYGSLSRPEPAQNPGAFDSRRQLAADRIFAQIRIPRPSGVVILQDSGAPTSLLTAFRLFLRGKLLEHTLPRDVDASLTLTALLLGTRDRAIADVSQSFADAGIAHLLAISGSHIVFFTGIIWSLLRFLPLRPRWRELLIAALVMLYVLATPCGPPILRAAVALLAVLLARMLGRPRAYLNILAGAAVVVVLLRPTDIADAGFQLSFVTTAGLILFSRRVHAALFEKRLARETLAAEISRSRLARLRLRVWQIAAAILTANALGALTAAPLVAYHFRPANLWAILAGIVAIPLVSAAMIVAAAQLLASLLGLGSLFAPIATLCGNAMIWLVARLAALPGAALPLRPPPAWLVLAIYAALLLWAMRRALGLSRALIVNTALAAVVLSATWYVFSVPTSRLTVLSTGDGDCILLQTPRGTWAIDAGGQVESSTLNAAVRPALRLAGTRELRGVLFRALDPAHAREAGPLISACRPAEIWVPNAAWTNAGETLPRAQIASVAEKLRVPVKPLAAGDTLILDDTCRIEVLSAHESLFLCVTCNNHRILIADPKDEASLALLPQATVAADLVVFTGARRGDADAALLQRVAELGAQQIIWCGRGIWSSRAPRRGEFNTVNGAVEINLQPRR